MKIVLVICLMWIVMPVSGQSQARFPKPEFDTGYVQPDPSTPEPRALAMDYFDVFVLILVLSLATYFAIRRRSRGGILLLSVFTLIYFGFFRNGCICSIGAIQNVALTLFDPNYSISLVALLFFIIPLLFTLFFGRTFCAGACPLGAIQDLLIFKPISIPVWLRKGLGLIPFLYLGLAVLFAATGTDFIICRWDPYVGIFRMDARFIMIVLGVAMLLIGLFVARPYCRFLCPYGVLLNWTSRFSKYHMAITPSSCINCKLCETSCPFDAIDIPQEQAPASARQSDLKKFLVYLLIIPLLMGAGAFIGYKSHVFLSKAHSDVYLAELLIKHPEVKNDIDNLDVQAFLSAGETLDTLVKKAGVIRAKFKTGSWILGAFMGLVIGVSLLAQTTHRKNDDYRPDKGNCYSCGRCMDYCPVEK
ncbi:MAG: 4Fe-4S binding protein [Bacteroidetes bacterium]|nr:4Fe-4S binding protein [Bacteroidota bacterium]MBT4400557.1 4Fe-4S binding protein [Bacteroidota bacterium]MBT4411804.1 4Fe-4S binding protein [Bacteroidota bacterium]MBT5426445.1 4Fe-4S binding protein [Bacteroidota bacterium]MBT7465210.1 4Fe-4S binding protein [Bacteroidota bacterium]